MRRLIVLALALLLGPLLSASADPVGPAATLPPSVPVGFAISPAAVAAAPTSLDFSADGDTLYVASAAGVITAHAVVAGVATGAATVFLDDLDGAEQPLGVLATDLDADGVDEVFVAAKEFNVATNRDEGLVFRARDTDGDGVADQVERVVSGLPNGRHNTNGLAVGPDDGQLYITNGNSTDSGFGNEGGDPELQPWSGSLLRIAPTATDADVADTVVVGTGWRNIYDVAFAPDGHPLNPTGGGQIAAVPMNGPDGQTYNGVQRPRGEDTLSILDVATDEIEHFGFPWCLYDRDQGGLDGFIQDADEGACDPLPSKAFDGLPDGVGVQAKPSALFGMHVSANGLDFNPGPAFPPEYENDLFVAEWGNIFGDELTGHKVVRVSFADDGSVADVVDFMTGVVPLDLTFAPDGSLWVADMAGTIFRVDSLL